ncbi:DNA cytosine methyltransferase [Helicobacter cetorum]|uniref:DNA cytosine methyltransferase n=1 Tax=Helicobacter cetorum TaxID=138563 RepID=UPI000CF0E617|nr:DNA cytosine methyltransferase [Helicobacter cetorum]
MLKIASVFSGIGAFEWALKRLGVEHEVLFACDNGNIDLNLDYDKELQTIKSLSSIEEKRNYTDNLYRQYSKKTNFVKISYLANYTIKNNRFFQDIKLFDGTDFKDKIDILVGGSPCQSFSSIGKKLGLEDTRGTLFYDYIRVLKEIEPKVFIFENVYGMLRHDKGKTFEVIQKAFESLGYFYKYEILDARNYGIPQGRRRLFLVGFKEQDKCLKFKFPSKKELTITMQDLLQDNIKEGNLLSKNAMLQIKTDGGERVNEKYFLSEKLLKYCLSAGTKNFYHADAKIDLPIARALLSTMGNHHRSSINNYVTTNNQVRSLSVREAHRLMGFDDSYKIVVSKAQGYKQAGNSIVVDVLIALLKEILRVMP